MWHILLGSFTVKFTLTPARRGGQGGGGLLRISSDTDDRSILGGLKFFIPVTFLRGSV